MVFTGSEMLLGKECHRRVKQPRGALNLRANEPVRTRGGKIRRRDSGMKLHDRERRSAYLIIVQSTSKLRDFY